MDAKRLALIGSLACACEGGTTAAASNGESSGDTTAAAQTTDAPATTASHDEGSSSGGDTTTSSPSDESGGSDTGEPDDYPTDPLHDLPTGEDQHDALCSRGHGDPISLAFCATPDQPPIGSLVELQNFVGLDTSDPASTSFAFSSHSSSLVMRLVSPLNPRAIIFKRPLGGQPRNGNPLPNPEVVAMGFTRGEQFVELAAKDPTADDLVRFFLFRFAQGCNDAPGGCTNGDRFTPAIESGYTSYTLYEDVDIANTVFDCKQCHQPDGPGTTQILRMQELQFPWHHWLFDEPEGDVFLCADYRAAHVGEDYAGVPAVNFASSCRAPQGTFAGPPALENFIENNGFLAQPNEFVTDDILAEVVANNPAQPGSNVPPGQSATWNALYDAYLGGVAIPPPYHDFRVTDAAKLAAMTDAYNAVRGGSMPADQLPDITDVFLDEALPDMTIRPRPGATGEEILRQMCIQCHNSRLDQTISRAKFNVEDLAAIPAAEKAVAIERLTSPKDSAKLMPPARFRELSDDEIALAIGALSQ
jgi:mono/diheme cytochrome c family protein